MSTQPHLGMEPLWLATGQAAAYLNISNDTLKRYADRDEFLIEGKHFRRGVHRTSPRVWEVRGIQEAMARRGRHGHRSSNAAS